MDFGQIHGIPRYSMVFQGIRLMGGGGTVKLGGKGGKHWNLRTGIDS
jgi:hypothetical protein